MIRLKELLVTGVKMKKIGETNMLLNKCNKKQVINQEAMKIDYNDVCEIIEDVHRRDNFDKEFDIGLISKCEYDEDTSTNEKKVVAMSYNKVYWCLILYYITMIQN